MSATASGREAASYNEERRLAKLARLRGTGRRRRQPQPHAMTSPPPPDEAFSPPPPNEAPPENWDDVPVGGKGRTPQRIDDDDAEPAAYDGGSWRSASKPARAPRPRASPTKVPTAREWDDTPVGGAQRPPPQQAERKRAPAARRPVVSQREWDEMPVGHSGGGQVWTEYPEGETGPPPRAATPDSDSDSTGSLEMRPAPARRDWDDEPVSEGAKQDWDEATGSDDDERPAGGAGRAPVRPVESSSARDSDEATPVASDDERPFATDDEPADAKDWDDQPVGGGGGARDWAEYPEEDDAPRSARREESDRRAASPLTYDATPLQPSPAPPSPRPSPAPPSPTRPERPPCTLEDLRDRWGTCVYLLRSPDVRDAQALEKTRQAAEDGVAYVEEVKTVAQRLKIRGGALSKMLLPYGEETSTLEQAHTSNRAEYERLEELGLPEQRARELVDKALAARSLVRVKVADDNDLEQMLLACGELRDFFDDLEAHARRERAGAFDVFATLE
ncbi:unnamed protein product [Pelagomonas calceolata]|uniref:Uncharacterized protein n=1 Tax=Pelagomonas calceolata TaxID=35677 RepID=A0A8J2SHS6_9STRA|nr:unnamed protein product [Pelagomonas calceolata]